MDIIFYTVEPRQCHDPSFRDLLYVDQTPALIVSLLTALQLFLWPLILLLECFFAASLVPRTNRLFPTHSLEPSVESPFNGLLDWFIKHIWQRRDGC